MKTKVPKLQIKQTNYTPNFKLHNLETLDFLTSPTIEEESWLAQNVLKHVFVYKKGLEAVGPPGITVCMYEEQRTQTPD